MPREHHLPHPTTPWPRMTSLPRGLARQNPSRTPPWGQVDTSRPTSAHSPTLSRLTRNGSHQDPSAGPRWTHTSSAGSATFEDYDWTKPNVAAQNSGQPRPSWKSYEPVPHPHCSHASHQRNENGATHSGEQWTPSTGSPANSFSRCEQDAPRRQQLRQQPQASGPSAQTLPTKQREHQPHPHPRKCKPMTEQPPREPKTLPAAQTYNSDRAPSVPPSGFPCVTTSRSAQAARGAPTSFANVGGYVNPPYYRESLELLRAGPVIMTAEAVPHFARSVTYELTVVVGHYPRYRTVREAQRRRRRRRRPVGRVVPPQAHVRSPCLTQPFSLHSPFHFHCPAFVAGGDCTRKKTSCT